MLDSKGGRGSGQRRGKSKHGRRYVVVLVLVSSGVLYLRRLDTLDILKS
jgi:hypothetical protein